MSMSPEDIQAIVFYRKQKAYATLQEAEDMIQNSSLEFGHSTSILCCFLYGVSLIG